MEIYSIPPKLEKKVMEAGETKKCKIIPKKNKVVLDLLPNNKKIEKETTMEINRNEIARAMSAADVYLIGNDGSQTLLNEENYYLSLGTSESDKENEGDDNEPSSEKSEENNPTTNQPQTQSVRQQSSVTASSPNQTTNTSTGSKQTVSTNSNQQKK